VKYQFTGQMSYDLPVGEGRAVKLSGFSNAALGGWTVNAIAYLSTGVPIASPTSGISPSYFNQRADITCNAAPHTTTVWFSYSCFSDPASALVPGNAPAYLDHVRTRGARDLDLSLYKTFALGETKSLRFDISTYNLTNTPQYGYPNVASNADVNNAIQQAISAGQPIPPNPADFGTITNTVNTPRQFQFGARFTF
jgi:hypothetical protein